METRENSRYLLSCYTRTHLVEHEDAPHSCMIPSADVQPPRVLIMHGSNSHFWNQLIIYADEINKQSAMHSTGESDRLAIITEYLGTLDEIYGRSIDPVENFEAYATVELCRAILKAIS